jgi:hypothetical protein
MLIIHLEGIVMDLWLEGRERALFNPLRTDLHRLNCLTGNLPLNFTS